MERTTAVISSLHVLACRRIVCDGKVHKKHTVDLTAGSKSIYLSIQIKRALKAAKKWRHNKNQRQIFMERRGGRRRPFSPMHRRPIPRESYNGAAASIYRPRYQTKMPTTATTIEAKTAPRSGIDGEEQTNETWK
jgi:hypothetical protein